MPNAGRNDPGGYTYSWDDKESLPRRPERMKYLESKAREVCTERGLNWDTMTDEERQDFINDVVHEDRECAL